MVAVGVSLPHGSPRAGPEVTLSLTSGGAARPASAREGGRKAGGAGLGGRRGEDVSRRRARSAVPPGLAV